MIEQKIFYEWQSDSQFAELKEAEMIQERLNLLQSMNFADEIVGNFFSKDYVRRRILKQTQEEIEHEDKQIELEKATAPAAPEGEDEYQAFVPKNGGNLQEALDKVVEKKIVDKEQEKELKNNLNDIFKTVLEEGSDDSRAN